MSGETRRVSGRAVGPDGELHDVTLDAPADLVDDPHAAYSIAADASSAQHRLHHDLIEGALDQLEDTAVEFNRDLVGARDLTFVELLALLNRAQVALDAVQTSVAGLHRAAWQARGDAYGDLELEGLPPVSVRRTASRKRWDNEALVGQVLDRHLDAGDGDMPAPWTVAEWLTGAAHVDYWRVGVLKELGVDPDDYCEKVEGNPKIEFQRSGGNPLLAGDATGSG